MEEKSSAIPEKKAEETLPETTSSTTTSNNTEANVEKTNEITKLAMKRKTRIMKHIRHSWFKKTNNNKKLFCKIFSEQKQLIF